MQIRALIILLVIIITTNKAAYSQQAINTEDGVHFQNSLGWPEILELAKNRQKYIFLDIYTTWCAPCKKMDAQVYSNDTVGTYINENFISVKIQMDTTLSDNASTKKWYEDAKRIGERYKIEGYPTLLFLSPQGTLEYKAVGYHSPTELLNISNLALHSNYGYYYAELNNYNNGIKNYDSIQNLSRFVKNVVGNDSLALIIAKDFITHKDFSQSISAGDVLFTLINARDNNLADSLAILYKSNYLDKIIDDNALTKNDIIIFNYYYKLLTSSDKLFKLCYSNPSMINKIAGDTIWQTYLLDEVITKEEIRDKLVENKKPLFKNPGWESIRHTIEHKYPSINTTALLLHYKTHYYKNIDLDWRKWAIYQDSLIIIEPPRSAFDAHFVINQAAWKAFLHCNDKIVLKQTLSWMNMILDKYTEYVPWLDTKANLLYKMGKYKDALKYQKKAVALLDAAALPPDDPDAQEIRDNYEKMKRKIPTWSNTIGSN